MHCLHTRASHEAPRLFLGRVGDDLQAICLFIARDAPPVAAVNYRLIYRLRSGDVQIVTVHHGARELNRAELESGA